MNSSTPSENARRHETDREDIMREATALHRRASFRLAKLGRDEVERRDGAEEYCFPHGRFSDSFGGPVVAGFRRTGAMAIYFDQDPVYQFDVQGRLRRSYRDGLLYRTQGITLAELTRTRTKQQTTLLRRDLELDELKQFQREMADFLRQVEAAFVGGLELLEVKPDGADLVDEILEGVRNCLTQANVLAPAIPTRRG